MIKAVIFDMGGVLLESKLEDIVAKVAEKLNLSENFFGDTKNASYKDSLTGKIKFKEFAQSIILERDIKLSVEEFLKLWKDSYLEVMSVNEELRDYAKKLSEKYKIALVSNLNDFHGSINYERNLFDIFNPCLLSYEVGISKPDKRIFELVLNKLEVFANDCIFVDDREGHLVPAKELGINTILFENNQQVFEKLRKLGIKE